MYKKFSRIYTKMLKRALILFMLSAYVFVPFVDSIACDDCIGTTPFQGKGIKSSHAKPSNANALSLSDTDTNGDKSSSQKGIKYSCSICFNAAKMVSAYNTKTVFSPVSIAFQSAFLTLSEPVFSINKPPQN